MNVFNIPSQTPFTRALAAELLRRCEGKPEALPQYRILLPTRRACRTLREAFLKMTDGAPLLLPRMQPLGDIDEEELALTLSPGESVALAALPPAMPSLQRRILLARLVMAAEGFAQGPAHALALADSLARLIDRIHTEGLAMESLPALVPDDFAAHWQVTLKFLEVISHEWPNLLQSMGLVDTAQRRNFLMKALAEHWGTHPPQTPVIAAGSTGSIPATAQLLKVIAQMPQGIVVLPGLDADMDDESWEAIDDSHPQATLKHLLNELGIERGAVKDWPHDGKKDAARRALASEIMRPADTTGAWANLKSAAKPNLRNILRSDCATAQEEARFIAALFRKTLETPGKTAALVTPDRALARRVAAACRRWNIGIDDSAGTKLHETDAGIFMRAAMRAFTGAFAPGALLPLLRHKLCKLDVTDEFEIRVLRGPKPPRGSEGLRARAGEKFPLLDALETAFAPLQRLDGRVLFIAFLDAHIEAAENIAGGAENLWRSDNGEAMAEFLAELRACAADLPEMNAEDYLAALEQFMESAPPLRPRMNTHPRLSILGQLEARLFDADLIIMGGLNEGIWPPAAGHDPFLSRPMMKQFGLPSPERSTGLSAHDFVQGFCAPETVLTRAKRIDGTPAVPSRWLQRLDTVLRAHGIKPDVLEQNAAPLREALRALDESAETKPAARPAPKPPASLRPRALSVTKIETWLRDPYSIYAKHILKLKKLDEPEQPPDAAARGDILHKAMERFIAACPDSVPENAERILLEAGRDLIACRADDPGFWDFWWPRFARIAAWTVEHEKEWRKTATPLKMEAAGKIKIHAPGGDFILSARADRIDALRIGGCAIIDYKSGGQYSKSAIKSGAAPQLPLEALILSEGGFEGIAASAASYLGYWVLTGGGEEGKIIAAEGGLQQIVDDAREGLMALVAAFDDPATPYYSLPDPDRPLRYTDYEHLARVQEWAALGEEAEAA